MDTGHLGLVSLAGETVPVAVARSVSFMHECQRVNAGCPVHRAAIEQVRTAYVWIITAAYSKNEQVTINKRTNRIMLDYDGSRALDEQDTETLELAALAAPKWAEAAAAYVAMLYQRG